MQLRTSMWHGRRMMVWGLWVISVLLPTQICWAEKSIKKVLFLTKSAGFEHGVVKRLDGALSHAEHVLMDLGKTHGFRVEATKDASVFDRDLSGYDAFAFFTTGDLTQAGNDKQPPMSLAGKQSLLDAITNGKGFIGFHCASDTFHSVGNANQNQRRRDPYIDMVGGEFITHGRQQKAKLRVVNPDFPGMEALDDRFTLHDEWYCLKNFATDMHVLLGIESQRLDGKDYQRAPFPATWVRRHGKGRVFYTAMGHREDVWTNPTFQDITVGGVRWALGEVDIEVPANIDEVTPQASELP